MSKHGSKRRSEVMTPSKGMPCFSIAAVGVLALAIVVSLGLWLRAPMRSDAPPVSRAGAAANVPVAPTAPATPATSAAPEVDFGKLKGKWVRTDSEGNYVLEIATVAESKQLDASYHNPRPIHVSKAEASQVGQAVKVFVELRDVKYPGCTYDLTYDPPSDSLQGIYFQAALQQQFDVVFVRTNQ
jgi:hypothetical protein